MSRWLRAIGLFAKEGDFSSLWKREDRPMARLLARSHGSKRSQRLIERDFTKQCCYYFETVSKMVKQEAQVSGCHYNCEAVKIAHYLFRSAGIHNNLHILDLRLTINIRVRRRPELDLGVAPGKDICIFDYR